MHLKYKKIVNEDSLVFGILVVEGKYVGGRKDTCDLGLACPKGCG